VRSRKHESSAPGWRSATAPFRSKLERTRVLRLEDEREIAALAVVLATGAQYRGVPVEGLARYEGVSVFYAAGPPEAQLCGAERVALVAWGNSAGQAAVWLARGGALVTLLRRRADLRETMSDYLIHELERYGVAIRARSAIAELHGADGELEAVRLRSGERLPLSFLFLFLGARPCTEWLARRRRHARRGRLHPHRWRRGRGGPPRVDDPGRLCSRWRALARIVQ
jgi:thioredoxin reductase (NADPH)